MQQTTEDTTRVLVVDDEIYNRELICELLEEQGYVCDEADSGTGAWTKLVQHPKRWQVILLDKWMPGMDGIRLLKQIKDTPELAELPVIMQTAADAEADVVEGIEAGAYYYLTKPIEADTLCSIVAAAVSDYRRFQSVTEEVRRHRGTLALMSLGEFSFRTLDEASDLGAFLANACPDPEQVVIGLTERMVNAIEHGNLEISYEEKTELSKHGRWLDEVDLRLSDPRYARRRAHVRFQREDDTITITIRDEGRGFEPAEFLQFDPARAFHTHGRGIAIANQLSFDELSYRDGGRQVVGVLHMASDDDEMGDDPHHAPGPDRDAPLDSDSV